MTNFKRNPGSSGPIFRPHPTVADLLADEVTDEIEAKETSTAASKNADALFVALVALDSDLDSDPVVVDEAEKKLRHAERIEHAAHARASRTISNVRAAEGVAFRDPTLIAELPDRIVGHATGVENVEKKIDELVEALRDLAYDRKVVGYIVQSVRMGTGDVQGNWSGSSRDGGITGDTRRALDQILAEARRFPHSKMIAQAVIGEGGLDRVPGLPIPAADLPRETLDTIKGMVDTTHPKVVRWLNPPKAD